MEQVTKPIKKNDIQNSVEATRPSSLNALFSLESALQFVEGPNSFTVAELKSDRGSASVALHGGQVLSYQPSGQSPVLWTSDHARYEMGRAIRGGIPICWPWFGPHPADSTKPSHGFARNRIWEVFSARMINDEHPQLHLTLSDDALTRSLWDYRFHLELIVTLADDLHVELQIRNTGDAPFISGGALHTYLNISHISAIAIHGLEGASYIDQLAPAGTQTQNGPIRIDAEVDRIYLDTAAPCQVVDPGLQRKIEVAKSGSRSTVIWNPWIDKAARMSDFGDSEYQKMVCIETANAASDTVEVTPGGLHRLETRIRVAAL